MMINGFLDLLMFVAENISTYIIILILCSSVYFYCLRRCFIDLFDPFIFALAGCIFAASTMVFMYNAGLIYKTKFFWQFIFSEIAAWGSFYVISHRKLKVVSFKYYNTSYEKDKLSIYICLCVIYFAANVYTYLCFGLGVSAENHVAAVVSSGAIGRLAGFCLLPITILLYDRWYSGYKIDSILVGIFIGTTLILTGSKSSFLTLCVGLFFYRIYRSFKQNTDVNYKKIYALIFFAATIVSLFTIAINAQNNDFNYVLIKFGERLVGYGDGFAYAYMYSGALMDFLMDDNDLFDLLTPILSMLRLVPMPDGYTAVGNQMVNIVYGTYGAASGPNLRHNMFSLLAFGYLGSIVASAFFGAIIAFFTRQLFYRLNFNIYTFLAASILYTNIFSFWTDPLYAIENIIRNVLFIFIVFGSIYFIKNVIKL